MTASAMHLRFRTVQPQDFDILRTWRASPHVLEWWPESLTEEEFEDYCVIDANQASRFFIALLDEEPIGFIQTYSPVEGHAHGWWLDEHDPRARGMDQFLGNELKLNVGLGTQMIRAFVNLMLEDPAVIRIQVDPAPNNLRAIRCYEKAGFRRVREIDTPDGPALLMYLEKTSLF